MAKGKNNGKKTGAGAKRGGSREMLLVGSKVKAAIREANCNTSGDALEGLNEWVHWLIAQATRRAQENKRKTVRNHDFMV